MPSIRQTTYDSVDECMIHGLDKVLRALAAFERNANRRADDFAYELKTSIIRETVRGRHIKTARFIRAIDYHRQAVVDGEHRFAVDASSNPDVFYDGFLEFPRKGWPGAYVYQKGIQNVDFERIADKIASESFVV